LHKETPAGNFSNVPGIADAVHLLELGINALELLPPAEAKTRELGYAIAYYLASDYDLGFPI
jgi:pullulanase